MPAINQYPQLKADDGASNVNFTQAGSNAATRSVQDKLRDMVSVKDFGAVGNGIANDTAAIQAADSADNAIFVPAGTYRGVNIASTSLRGPFYGDGQIVDSNNNKRGKFFAAISAAPASLGNHNSVETSFNGDISKLQFAVEHRITGAATLGQPTSGYLYTPEAYPYYTYVYNASGYNHDTATNNGRTGAVAHRVNIFQAGQGDLAAFNASAFVTGTRAGSTHFLANPAVALFNGDLTAGQDGVYLNCYETIASDAGYDVACVGIVNNFIRTNTTGAKSVVWMGYRAQSQGPATCDAVVSATGKWISGLDFTPSSIDFGANQAAIALRAGHRIYFNANDNASGNLEAGWRATGGFDDYIAYNSGSQELQFVGAAGVQFAMGRVASSVNYLRLSGAATSGLPGLFAQGSDTNISVGYRSKGAGEHFFYSDNGGAVQFQVGRTASAVNYFNARGGAVGSSVVLEAVGSDANIGAVIATKGTGSFLFRTGGSGGTTQFQISSNGDIGIRDGVTAPSATSGIAKIYVDVSDGDLKIIFGDGTVKTIVTDS